VGPTSAYRGFDDRRARRYNVKPTKRAQRNARRPYLDDASTEGITSTSPQWSAIRRRERRQRRAWRPVPALRQYGYDGLRLVHKLGTGQSFCACAGILQGIPDTFITHERAIRRGNSVGLAALGAVLDRCEVNVAGIG
jgi:hypothetical protein